MSQEGELNLSDNKCERIRKLAIYFLIIVVLNTASLVKGVTWSSEFLLTTDPDPDNPAWDMNPSITQTMQGSIWVVWVSDREVVQDELYYKTSSDYGSSWSEDRRLTTDPDFDENPSIIQAKNGFIWVVWATDRNGNYDIYYKTSYNYGSSWSGDTPLITNSSLDQSPSVWQDAEGRIWVVWHRKAGGNYDIYYKTSSDYGSSWSEDRRLTTDPDFDENPSIIQAKNGFIWVVWATDRNGNYDIYYKTSYNYGSSWSGDTPLTTDPDFDENPSVIQASDGSIWVVWTTDRHGNQYELYYANSSDCGSTWSENRLTSVNVDDIGPSITKTDEGTIWIAWARNVAPDDFDVLYTISDAIPVHDVAITDVTSNATTVYKGETVSISVVAENQGTEAETFEVNCYANTTLIESQTTTLDSGTSTTLVFLWDTSFPYGGYYTISANTSIPEETLPNMADNTFTDGTVQVKLIGDINGDGHVGLADAIRLSTAYGQIPNPDPEADLNNDGIVGLKDAVILSTNWTG